MRQTIGESNNRCLSLDLKQRTKTCDGVRFTPQERELICVETLSARLRSAVRTKKTPRVQYRPHPSPVAALTASRPPCLTSPRSTAPSCERTNPLKNNTSPAQSTRPCSNGVSGYEAGGTCCPLSCGSCGGSGCSSRGDGCCTSDIKSSGDKCSEKKSAPCIIDTDTVGERKREGEREGERGGERERERERESAGDGNDHGHSMPSNQQPERSARDA